jgi:hypothetical protein
MFACIVMYIVKFVLVHISKKALRHNVSHTEMLDIATTTLLKFTKYYLYMRKGLWTICICVHEILLASRLLPSCNCQETLFILICKAICVVGRAIAQAVFFFIYLLGL